MLLNHHQLEDDIIKLDILTPAHIDALLPIALEPELFQYTPRVMENRQHFEQYVLKAIKKMDEGQHLPFAIYHKELQKYIGSTRFYNISDKPYELSIGYTWYGREYRCKGHNARVKQLMLDYAFKQCQCVRLSLYIDKLNEASCRAAEKCGFVLEGVLRKHLLMPSGRYRDTAVYAVIDDDYFQSTP